MTGGLRKQKGRQMKRVINRRLIVSGVAVNVMRKAHPDGTETITVADGMPMDEAGDVPSLLRLRVELVE